MLIIHIFLGSSPAGSAVVLALAFGFDTLVPVVAAAPLGFAVAFPVSRVIARRLSGV